MALVVAHYFGISSTPYCNIVQVMRCLQYDDEEECRHTQRQHPMSR